MSAWDALLQISGPLNKLSEGKGKNRDQYPVLNTELIDPEKWWNELNFNQKMEVGDVAIHYHKMTANYRWNCYDTKYIDLKQSQKKIIKFVLSQKDTPWQMFYLHGLFKTL